MNQDYINRSQEWLITVLSYFDITPRLTVEPPGSTQDQLKQWGGCWLTIEETSLSPQQIERLIGDQGQVIDAIQYLLNATLHLEEPPDVRENYTVELSNFRSQRYGELAQLAEQAVMAVRQSGGQYEMPPLSSAERRLVHTMLCEEVDVETHSYGEGLDRRLVVQYVSSQEVSTQASSTATVNGCSD